MTSPLVALDTLPRYAREIDNLRAALEWSFSHDPGDLGVGLVAAAVPVFPAMSLLSECHRWSERGLQALDDARRGTAEEMRLQDGLGHSLMFTRGGNDEARTALERGLVIAEERRDFPYQVRLLEWLTVFHYRGGHFRTALQYAKRISAVAKMFGDPGAIALAHFLVGNSLYVAGELAGARAELEATPKHRSRTIYSDFDQYVGADMSLASTLCMQGYPDRAISLVRRTLDGVREAEHSVTSSIVLRHSALLFIWIGDLQTAERLADRYIANAQSHSFAPQIAAGRGLKAELAIRRGDAQNGVAALKEALGELEATQYMILTSTLNIALAEGLAAAGRFAEALKVIDDAIRFVEDNGDMVYMPELLRVRGATLVAMPLPRLDEAEAHFASSLELSRRQGARSGELRTAIDLAKLMIAQGRGEAARALLEPMADSFDEGFDTVDFRTARGLLTTL